VPLFSELSRRDLARLAKAAVSRRFAKGQIIVKDGEQAVTFYIISTGKAEVTKGKKTLATLKAGDFFGEMALLDGYLRSASVKAIEDTECLVLSRWDFIGELQSNPRIAVALLPILSRRLREADKKAAM
jgi:CRP-like cAMP-binding protein